MIKKFKEVFGKTDDVLREYSMVLVMAFLAAVSAIYYINYDYNSRDYSFFYIKFGLVASLGISVMFALKILSQRIGKEILLQLLGILFLLFYYFLFPVKENQFTEVYAFLLIPTFILSHLLVSFIAFIGRNRELSFWQYNKNLFINIFLTAVFTGVLTGGIMLAIAAVDNLFDFHFDSRFYSYTFSFFSIFGSCFIFLLFNEKGLVYLEKNDDYPVILKFFTQYVLVPLLLIYAIILYFYSAKILINWELPRGWVSYLILAYSVVGILAILLVHPLKEDSTKSWVRIFSKIFYYTLAPLIILLFVAIFTRILEYGYTEPRYFVLLLALWLTSVVLYFIFIRKQTIKFVPMSLFVFGLFSLTFPYLNTFSVAKRSQKNELLTTLNQKNILENGMIDFNKKISGEVADEITNKFNFLSKRNENEFLLNLLPLESKKIFEKDIHDGKSYAFSNIRSKFTAVKYTNKGIEDNRNTRLISKNKSVDISEYQLLVKANGYENTNFEFQNNKFELESTRNPLKTKFTLLFNDQEINLFPKIKELFINAPRTGEQSEDHLFIIQKIGDFEIKILFDSINRISSPNKSDEYMINSESVLILIKKE
ncbi:MAG: DUF4153 domain-containing protein [Flavobacteriales bacterium]|nr:DUF4153 domain-containing protein [Flavobacteriales bacterium]